MNSLFIFFKSKYKESKYSKHGEKKTIYDKIKLVKWLLFAYKII